MILILWGVLFLVSIIFLIIGYSLKNDKNTSISDVLIPISWLLLFFLSVAVLFNQVEIQTSSVEFTEYSYFANSSLIKTTSTSSSPVYSAYDTSSGFFSVFGAKTIGFMMIMISIAGFIIFWSEYRHRGDEYE